MRLVRIIAGLGSLVLVARCGWAQHGVGSAHAGSAGTPVVRPFGGMQHMPPTGGASVAVRPLAGTGIQLGRGAAVPPVLLHLGSPWHFPHQGPGDGTRGFAFGPTFYPPRHWILRPEFDVQAERFRRYRYYQVPFYLQSGAGGVICNPFWPGYFSPYLWYDNQFRCFGVPFFGVSSYPSSFLAPDLAYEPWFENLRSGYQRQMYPSADGQAAGALDMIAGIAARETADSNPSVKVTQVVLKEGIMFGLTDYWVEGNKFYYVTTDGRQNAIDLDRVDLEKTIKVNSIHGIPFVLHEKQAGSSNPSG